MKPLKFALVALLGLASSAFATVFTSDGNDQGSPTACDDPQSIQCIHDTLAHDGDTITLPGGSGAPNTTTFVKGVNITKGITISGGTIIHNPGKRPGTADPDCWVEDNTIIIDNKNRGGGKIFKVSVPDGKSFRMTGITVKIGTVTQIGGNGGIEISNPGTDQTQGYRVKNVRVDNCHFDHLAWEANLHFIGWVTGVVDHCFIDSGGGNFTALIWHDNWGGPNFVGGGGGSWADYPYLGSDQFVFFETNTIQGTGNDISGTWDSFKGGRFVVRNNYIKNCAPGGHGTEAGGVRGERMQEVYGNKIEWTKAHGGHSHRSGGVIWHDNEFIGIKSQTITNTVGVGPVGSHSALPYFRMYNAVGNSLLAWGVADGANGWDINDPAGVYASGTVTGATTISASTARFMPGIATMTTDQWKGYQVRNDTTTPGHAAVILGNTNDTIAYYYYCCDRGAPLVFNIGDAWSIRKVLVALDQAGRGKGDNITPSTAPDARVWPNQAKEPLFSWNNINDSPSPVPAGQSPVPMIMGFNSDVPTQIQGSPTPFASGGDWYNMGMVGGATTPRPSPFAIPPEVQSAYPAEVNGPGQPYDHEFVYPHPLVSGASPSPTFTPTATATGSPPPNPTATATFTPTPTLTPTATATGTPAPTPTATATATATPTATPGGDFSSVILNTESANLLGYWKCDDPPGTVLVDSSGHSEDMATHGVIGTDYFLGEQGEQGKCFRTVGNLSTDGGYAFRNEGVPGSIDGINFTMFALFKGDPTNFLGGQAFTVCNHLNENSRFAMGNNRGGNPAAAQGSSRGNGTTPNPQANGGVAFDNTWHSITWRRTGDVFDLFVDGVKVATTGATFATGSFLDRTSLMHSLAPGCCPTATYVTGSVQHAAIWNTNLSDAEITTIQNARSGVIGPTATPTPTPCNVPAAPTSLTATVISSSQINLAWTNNSVQTQVLVERGLTSASFTQIASLSGDTTTYPDTPLLMNTTYFYRVRGANACGNSNYSNVVSATTLATSPTPTATATATVAATATATPTAAATPAAPSGATATLIGCNTIEVDWVDNSSDEDGFAVESSPDNITYTQYATVLPNITTYTSSGWQQNHKFWFRVRAFRNPNIFSLYSNKPTATTTTCATPTATATATPTVTPTATPTATGTPSPTPTPIQVPIAPQAFHVVKTPGFTTGFSVTWNINPVSDNVTSYKVYRSQKDPGLVATLPPTTNRQDVTHAMRGNRTTFYVTAVNAIGESEPSDFATVQQ